MPVPYLYPTEPVDASRNVESPREPPAATSVWAQLSEDLVVAVFARLNARDIARCGAVSRAWRVSAADEHLWQPLAQALRLPDCASKAYRSAVGHACAADANMRRGRATDELTVRHQDSVRVACFNPDGSKLATGSDDHTARLTDVYTGATLVTIHHLGSVRAVCFNPDGSKLATGSDDTTVRLTAVHTGAALATFRYQDSIRAICFSPDGSNLATGCFNHTARLTAVHTDATLITIQHREIVRVVCFSPDGSNLATGSGDATARLTAVHTGATLITIQHREMVLAMCFNLDGSRLVTGSVDRTARLTDVRTGATLASVLHDDSVWALSSSPDGSRLATGAHDGTAHLVDVLTDEILTTARHQVRTGTGRAVCFTPDGNKLATGFGCTARLTDVRTGATLAIIQHQKDVVGVSFSPDGSKLATVSYDHTARLTNYGGATDARVHGRESHSRSGLRLGLHRWFRSRFQQVRDKCHRPQQK